MGLALPRMTIHEFLAWESHQRERHEFHRGDVYAMTGGAARHNRVILNLAARLSDHVFGSGCQVFAESMKVRIADDAVLYPDIVVTCAHAQAGDEQVVRDPMLIVEVLSPSTRGYDKRDTFILYRALPSLREYALVDPASREIEVYTATAGGWVLTDQTGVRDLVFDSVGLRMAMDELFRGVAPA